MTLSSSDTLALATRLREELAGSSLPPSFAKLYSQHTRLQANASGLGGWRADEASQRLQDVQRLIEAAFVEKESRVPQWRFGIRRAGELLEWLAHPHLNPGGLPLRLLAAACYQLSGYPARASGLLLDEQPVIPDSRILRAFLKADFPTLLRLLTEQWRKAVGNPTASATLPWNDPPALDTRLRQWIVAETTSCLGVICATLRWGDETRTQAAIERLQALTKVLVTGSDVYSWLLARLCAEVAIVYSQTALRQYVEPLFATLSDVGTTAMERYLRYAFLTNRALAWPSQVKGIRLLEQDQSFVICTPTGSGKTTVAELAIIRSLFPGDNSSVTPLSDASPLALYLVPSKALAAEVESKLSRVLRRLADTPVIVTGLYGGTDWGPTDAWLTATDRTVLICTYEKGEALLRFVGPLFLHRLGLTIIDEAHSIQFDGSREQLRHGESRPLRLESLSARLLTYSANSHRRIIALSAVAFEAEEALASWVRGEPNSTPVKTSYRSTRQLIGRLDCLPQRRFEIVYDLLDGDSLQFTEGGSADRPFIPNPFRPHPPAPALEQGGPDKRLRPYLFWAGMSLAAADEAGNRHGVLMSITQRIGGYAEDFLVLLETSWANIELPSYFEPPAEPEKAQLWERCLRACEDYFGAHSREYRLLSKGIAVHHGKMPGLLARLLIEVVQQRIVHLVLATSTLTEGINLPFETVLLPNLKRAGQYLGKAEFSNLVGRAGRPGFATEGRTLVLVASKSTERSHGQDYWEYLRLIRELEQKSASPTPRPRSPLAELLGYLFEQWSNLTGSSEAAKFLAWLETTAPIEAEVQDSEEPGCHPAIEALDSLDCILLASIVENERLAGTNLSKAQIEERLVELWHRSYAHFASQEEERLGEYFVSRGKALRVRVYPNQARRVQLYHTSLPPRSAVEVLDLLPRLKEHFHTGGGYGREAPEGRFEFIAGVVELLGEIPKFRPRGKMGNAKMAWREVLHWWLDPTNAPRKPTVTQITTWHDYVGYDFGYRVNWGLGSIVGLILNEVHEGVLEPASLVDWPATNLPWVVFWLKELIGWGTLEPVAAYLLAMGYAGTRKEAEAAAKDYYTDMTDEGDDVLNAPHIRDWVLARFQRDQPSAPVQAPLRIKVKATREVPKNMKRELRVVPVAVGKEMHWFDLAGFELAKCEMPAGWQEDFLQRYDFTLRLPGEVVVTERYL
jgi:hypothetical protein